MKINALNSLSKTSFSRKDAIVWGIVLNIILLVSLVFWDAYIFYVSRLQERPKAITNVSVGLSFSGKDLDQVIKILDERAAEFERLSVTGAKK